MADRQLTATELEHLKAHLRDLGMSGTVTLEAGGDSMEIKDV